MDGFLLYTWFEQFGNEPGRWIWIILILRTVHLCDLYNWYYEFFFMLCSAVWVVIVLYKPNVSMVKSVNSRECGVSHVQNVFYSELKCFLTVCFVLYETSSLFCHQFITPRNFFIYPFNIHPFYLCVYLCILIAIAK